MDEYLKIGASTAVEYMKKFALDAIELFGKEYLRNPNQANIDRLLQVIEVHDFLGMLGSINCMH